MNLDYQDDYRAILDIENPYSYNFGRVKKTHTHTDVFQKYHNRYNNDFFDKR